MGNYPKNQYPVLERLQWIMERLRAGEEINATHVVEEFGVSRRTVHSDLYFLRKLGAGIEWDAVWNTYRLTHDKTPLLF